MNSRVVPGAASANSDALTLTTDEVSALKVAPHRHYGRWAIAVVLLLLLVAFVQTLATNQYIAWAVVGDYLFSPEILTGLKNTVLITAWAMGLAVVLGTVVAGMRLSSNPLASWLAWAFAWFFRSTPVLVQLFLWYNLALIFPTLDLGIPYTDLNLVQWDTNEVMTPFLAAVIALGLSESAYYSEIVRSGLISVDSGQREAAQSMGLTELQTYRKIVAPQAARIILPPTGNEFIGMLKYSSLASVIGYTELAGTAVQIYAVNLFTFELLIVISFWYLVATSLLSIVQYYLERRFGRGYARAAEQRSLGARLRSNLSFGRSRA